MSNSITATLVASMTDEQLIEWWQEIWNDPEYSHPQMEIHDVIEAEMTKRGVLVPKIPYKLPA